MGMINLTLDGFSKCFQRDSLVSYLFKYVKHISYIGDNEEIREISIYLSPIKYSYIKPYKTYIENDIVALLIKRAGIRKVSLTINEENAELVNIDHIRLFIKKEKKRDIGRKQSDSGIFYIDLNLDKTIHLRKIDTEFNIGRDAQSNHMIIPHRSISRNHAKIIRENGKYIIYDLDSKNGTYYNNRRINRYSVIDENNSKVQFGKIKCGLAV